jgi:hypothetical protein
MNHEATVVFRGEIARALDFAAESLTAEGFRIAQRAPDRVEATGPELPGGRALLGAQMRIVVAARFGELHLEAELLGLEKLRRRMVRFVVLLPLGFFILQGVAFTLLIPKAQRGWTIGFAGGLSAFFIALWLLLGPLIFRRFERRIRGALDRLLEDSAEAGARS